MADNWIPADTKLSSLNDEVAIVEEDFEPPLDPMLIRLSDDRACWYWEMERCHLGNGFMVLHVGKQYMKREVA